MLGASFALGFASVAPQLAIPYAARLVAGAGRGKVVGTGNKALLAEHGAEIFEKGAEKNVPIFFEAAVAGGIPIIKSIREAFIGKHIRSIHAILNGTSNYILSRMTEQAMDFPLALKEAQEAQAKAEAQARKASGHWRSLWAAKR